MCLYIQWQWISNELFLPKDKVKNQWRVDLPCVVQRLGRRIKLPTDKQTGRFYIIIQLCCLYGIFRLSILSDLFPVITGIF